MDTISRVAAGPRIYVDFEPDFEWVRDEGSDTLLLDLSGFKKEQIKAQVDNYGNLKISGERPDGNRWRRFSKEFKIPENCNASEIRAKFDSGILFMILPKLTAQIKTQLDRPMHVQERSSSKVEAEPKPSGNQDGTSERASSRISDDSSQQIKEKEKVQTDEVPNTAKVASDASDVRESEKDGKSANVGEEESMAKYTTSNDLGSWPKMKHGVNGLSMGLNKPWQLLLKVAVAIVVLMGLTLYITYKLRSP